MTTGLEPARASRVDQGRVRLRRRRRAAAREGRDLGRQRRRRAPEPRRRAAGLGLRRRAARGRRDAWERELGRIRVDGGTRDQRVVFYTALYHAMLTPNVYMDVDGQYRGRDLAGPSGRRLHVLLGVLALGHVPRAASAAHAHRPRAHRGFREDDAAAVPGGRTAAGVGARGQRDGHDDRLPRGAGDRRRDPQGHRRLRHDRSRSRRWSHSADERPRRPGRVQAPRLHRRRDASESVSRTLEYAYDDWCIAMVAAKLGRTDDAARFFRRAQSWRNLFDPSTGFMRARVEGPVVRAVRSRRSQQPLHRGERVAVQLLRAAGRRRADGGAGRAGRVRAQARRAVLRPTARRPAATRRTSPASSVSTRTATSRAITSRTSTRSPDSRGRRRRWCGASSTRCTRRSRTAKSATTTAAR